jgi:hypothetical protein
MGLLEVYGLSGRVQPANGEPLLRIFSLICSHCDILFFWADSAQVEA